MTSKKPASSKRAPLPRRADYTQAFAKDWERLSRSGRYDLHRLKEVMLLIVANDGPLPAQWRDHALRGSGEGLEKGLEGQVLQSRMLD